MASFNFGNASGTGLGATSTPAKPPAFGSFSFGATPAAAPPAFGAQAAAAPAGFGATAGSAFGTSAFGATSSAAPAFGFGTNTATTASSGAPAFGFGSTQAAPAAAAPSFGFGATTQPATGGGFGGFNAAPAATGFGGLGTAQPAASGFGGFGAPSAFGAANTASSAPLFSGFGTSQTNNTNSMAGGFGSFGSTFGKPAAAPSFNSTFGQSLLPAPQQQQQQQVPQTSEDALSNAILNVSIFGDERDAVLAKWNYLQAQWGTGKAFYNAQAPPFDIPADNVLCRFKTMGYCKLPGRDNKLGFVSLTFNKPIDQIRPQQQQLIDQLKQVFGNRPNLNVRVDNVKPLSETKCQATIYIEEKSATSNETKRIAATDVAAYLNQPTPKQQIGSLGVEQVIALVLPDEDQLKEYLDNAPKGIDPRLWKQAIQDNPDPSKLIPVPIVGFNELKWRIKCQENETETHTQYLQKVQRDVAELKQRHASTVAKIMEHRRKFADLGHRVLQIIVKQECSRKVGVALSPDEEVLRSKLENMQALVSAPTQFKGRLSELLSQMRMQRNQWNNANVNEYTLDKDSSEEMKTFLSMQQKAMAFLIETVNKDMKALKTISEGMKHIVRD